MVMDAAAIGQGLTVADYRAFVKRRPDGEKWELIDGDAVLNASPAVFHQIIVGNIISYLDGIAEATGASWIAMPGVAAVRRDDPFNAPEPDVMVVPGAHAGWKVHDPLCLFEVISPESRSRDLRRKPALYAAMPTVKDYVAISQKAREVVHYSRDNGWRPVVAADPESFLRLIGIGVDLPLARLYRRTPLAIPAPP